MSDDPQWKPPGAQFDAPPTGAVPPPPIVMDDPGGEPSAETDVVVVPGDSGSNGRSRWFVGGIVASVLALGGAGIFAVSNLAGESSGGAASPESLGAEMMTAIENSDVLGMIDLLSPGERDVLGDPFVEAVSELSRLEVLEQVDLEGLEWLDIELDDEQVVTTSTNVPDIVRISMRAAATITTSGADFPFGGLITDNAPSELVDEARQSTSTEFEELDVTLIAVDHDGDWYFSLFHTLAEEVRSDTAPDELIPLDGIGAVGADSPEAAFEGLLDEVEELDIRGVVQRLNPGEAAALQRYAPLFIDEAESAIGEVPLTWQITTREYRAETSGDRATIFVDAIAIEGEAEGEQFSVSVDGDCVSASAAGETIEQCGTSSVEEQLDVFGDLPETQALIEAFTDAFADLEPVGVEMRRFDGEWYLSPLTTGSEAVLGFLRALDRSEIDRIIELAPSAADELLGGFGSGFFDDSGSVEDDWATEAFEDADDSEPILDTASDDCWSYADATDAATCFTEAIESGRLPADAAPVALRFPECGFTAQFTGELYGMDDATFISTLNAAAPCFEDLLARGEISDWEMPSELLRIECFEGRNWYQVFDDPEYDDRYWECIS